MIFAAKGQEVLILRASKEKYLENSKWYKKGGENVGLSETEFSFYWWVHRKLCKRKQELQRLGANWMTVVDAFIGYSLSLKFATNTRFWNFGYIEILREQ